MAQKKSRLQLEKDRGYNSDKVRKWAESAKGGDTWKRRNSRKYTCIDVSTDKQTTFTNYSKLFALADGRTIYAELTNGYFCPVTRKALRQIAKKMSETGEKFCGDIVDEEDGYIRVTLLPPSGSSI
jgi:hypothetical protein